MAIAGSITDEDGVHGDEEFLYVASRGELRDLLGIRDDVVFVVQPSFNRSSEVLDEMVVFASGLLTPSLLTLNKWGILPIHTAEDKIWIRKWNGPRRLAPTPSEHEETSYL